MDRGARSRTSSASSARSPLQPATPSHTPNPAFAGRQPLPPQHPSPDQLAAGISRIRSEQGWRSSSIPATPAPTPNPLLQVTYHVFPEQLAAGISNIKVDEGYIDSTSFPATPAPSPFSPSPAQSAVFTPDQVAAGIARLREEGVLSGASTAQPPTPATTPGPGVAAAAAAAVQLAPERLVEGINHLRRDEGLDSGSNPGTPVPTPISPQPATAQRTQVLPEQLAAGIHRLKVEEGMSSGGSSGFPSTPAPTPFAHHPGGVRPEELAAGISRLSVIEEGVVHSATAPDAESTPTSTQPELSQYFSTESSSKQKQQKSPEENSFFDQVNIPSDASVLHSCRESRIDLPLLEQTRAAAVAEAKIDVVEQKFDDVRSLRRRQSSEHSSSATATEPVVCTIFSEDRDENDDPFDAISKQEEDNPGGLAFSAAEDEASTYATPAAPTPSVELPASFNNHLVPITSPLPNSSPTPAPQIGVPAEEAVNFPEDEAQEPENSEATRRSSTWIPNAATAQILQSIQSSAPGSFYPDRSTLTMPGAIIREDLADPVVSLVSHYRGEAEAVKRQVLDGASVTQDQNGLRQLVRAGCFRAAVNLTGKLLLMYNQGAGQEGSVSKHSPSSLHIWFTRLALLVKLRQFSVAEVEAEPFGDLDRPDLYFEFYPELYPNRSGSMVPFSFRLLLAELPQHLGKHHETLDRLYALLAKVTQILHNLADGTAEDGRSLKLSDEDRAESVKLWQERELRVLYSLCNSAIMHKDFELAVENLLLLLEKEGDERKAKVLSALGRIYLQLGDIESGQDYFSKAYNQRNKDVTADKCDNYVDMAFLSMAKCDYQGALKSFQEALELSPVSSSGSLINNVAVCYVYLGRLREGLSFLESRMTANPPLLLQETPILNLSTLYELESSYSGQKKWALLDLVSQYKGDGINTSCLKLQ